MTGNVVSVWIAELGIWPLIVVLLPNMFFRRYGSGGGYKRMASLYQSISVFLVTTLAAFLAEKSLPDIYFWAGLVVIVIGVILLRSKIFPYRRTCVQCDAKLDYETIYFRDANLCTECRKKKEAEEEAAAAAEAGEEVPPAVEASQESWPGSGPAEDDSGDGSGE